jgi:hypothetical protein
MGRSARPGAHDALVGRVSPPGAVAQPDRAAEHNLEGFGARVVDLVRQRQGTSGPGIVRTVGGVGERRRP